MDYEKLYKEAVERAMRNFSNEVATGIFPELKESEDEKIRKELIAHFKTNSVSESWTGLDVKKVIAWLEKQGEQKPSWSEDDEIALDDALWCCKQAASIAKDENDMGNVWYAEHWLKSLRPQNRWKPSKEQMEAFKNAILIKPYENPSDSLLWGLYEQLKKLKG